VKAAARISQSRRNACHRGNDEAVVFPCKKEEGTSKVLIDHGNRVGART
jgi:hypothetical protein